MERTLLPALACLFALNGAAQSTYLLDQFTSPYTPLTGDTPCSFDGNGLDAISELDGQLFEIFGQAFTAGTPYSMSIGDWGFLRFDGSGSSVIIDGLFTEIEAVDATSAVSYVITGAPGSYVLTAQWTNWHLSQGPPGNYASWQISIEQINGIISVQVGPNSGGGMVFNDATGPNCGVFMANNSFTVCQAKFWLEVDPASPTIDAVANFDFDALHALPVADTRYRFLPSWDVGVEPVASTGSYGAFVAEDGLHLMLPQELQGHIVQLLDASGREVLRARVEGSVAVLPTTAIAPGMHLLRWVDGAAAPRRVFVN